VADCYLVRRMAVRLRLTRIGGRKDPVWRVVVADQRSPRDGRVIETVGHYNAQTEPSTIVIDEDRVRAWLQRGAQPSGTVRKLSVEQFEEEDGTIVLELSVADDDYGKVIGRGGRTANALRTVVKAAAVREQRRVLIDIVE
jgi:small subunit ribosomal protein S16